MKRTLVLLHGFTGAPNSFAAVREHLRGAFEVLAPTLAGHGGESYPTSFEAEVGRLLSLLGARREVELCGYSLGARLALGMLLERPERFRSATLVGVHPGLAHVEERQARVEADARWALLLRTRGIAAFAAEWGAQHLFASQERVAPERLARQQAARLSHDAEGLACALETLGLGKMPCFLPRLADLTVPVALAAGELDTKFEALGRRAAERLRSGRLLIAPNAGHNLPLEQPEWLARVILEGQRT